MPNAFDLNGRGPSTWQLIAAGMCFIMVAAGAALAALAKSKGELDSLVRVTIALVDVGDGLPEKSDVKFRGVLVGHVTGVVTAWEGNPNIIHVDLKPQYAAAIPSTVSARVVPSNVFAVSSVQLVDNGAAATPVRSGAVIPEDTSLPTVVFQTSLNKFRQVFTALSAKPGDHRNIGLLATLAEATRGRGPAIGDAGRDLNRIVTQLNAVVGDGTDPSTISALADATVALRELSPPLFDALDNAVAPMRTLVDKRNELADFLAAGLTTATTLGEAFDHQTDRLINITTQLTPVVGVLADNAAMFPVISTRIKTVSDNFLGVFDTDRNSLTVKTIVSFTPFRSYVRADCPRYGELRGPSCETAPEVPTAPALYPALDSTGFTPPPGVTENRPNLTPPRDSMRHAGEVPGGPAESPESDVPANEQDPAAHPSPQSPSAQIQQQSEQGNVGPVGSGREMDQLSRILGAPANAVTALLLGPVARGATVTITPDAGGAQ